MTGSARRLPPERIKRWVAHPGCAAALLVVGYVLLSVFDLTRAARVPVDFVAVLVLVPVVTVLVVCPPLPKLHAKTLLTERLAWLWRYTIATFLLCSAGVLSVYFAEEFTRQDADVERETRLITAAAEVAGAAAVLGGFVFVVWLIIDLARLGAERRYAALTVALRKLGLPAGGQLARWAAFCTRPWWVLIVVIVLLGPAVQLTIDLGD